MLSQKRISIIAGAFVILVIGGLLVSLPRITPAPHLNDLNMGWLPDSLYAVVISVLVLFIGAGLGTFLVKPFRLEGWSFIEQTVISLPLGLGVIGYSVNFLGLAGWIKPIHLIGWLIILALISFCNGVQFLRQAIDQIINFRKTWAGFSTPQKIIFAAGFFALALSFFQALTPPWDYDGLSYHLQGPRLFLQAGRIIPIPENWFTYYPSTWEMIYLLGMGLGTDIFARLIHYSTMILLLLATYSFGKRFLPHPGGWLAAAILLGIPILPLWGNAAYTDIAWALFQFLAIGLFLSWEKERTPKLLILSGVMQGLALGSKYLALSGTAILLVFIFWLSLRSKSQSPLLKTVVLNCFLFGIATILVALPWYLKNYLWTENPVFPLYLPQNIIDPGQIKIWMDYVNSFGTGTRWFDYLLLPVNIYFQHEKFATFMGNMEMPNPIYLFVLVYPFVRRRIEIGFQKSLDILAVISTVFFIAWIFGSQQIRFLLPLFPGISILSVVCLGHIFMNGTKLYRFNRILKIGLIGGMVISTLIFMSMYMLMIRPDRGFFGRETKTAFIERISRDAKGLFYANENLTDNEKMMLLWDGRGYYCNKACLPDVDQSRWVSIVQRSSNIKDVTQELEKLKITHLFLSKEDVSFFVLKHDPSGVNLDALNFLLKDYVPKCAMVIHDDEWSRIYKLTLDNPDCQ